MSLDLEEFFQYVCDQIDDFGSHDFKAVVDSVSPHMATLKLDFNPLTKGFRPVPILVTVRYLYDPKIVNRMKDTLYPPHVVFHIEKVSMLDSKNRPVKIVYSKQVYVQDHLSDDAMSNIGSIGAVLAAGIFHDAEAHIKAHEHSTTPKIDKTFLTKFYALVATEVNNNTRRLFTKVQKVEDNQASLVLRDIDAEDEPNYDTTPFYVMVSHSYTDTPNPHIENPNLIVIPKISFRNSEGYAYTQNNLNLTLGQAQATNATAMHAYAKAVAIAIADGIVRLK